MFRVKQFNIINSVKRERVMKALIFAGFIVAAAVGPAYAMTYYLVAQWSDMNGNMCRYSNGTVLNVGVRICPLSIQG